MVGGCWRGRWGDILRETKGLIKLGAGCAALSRFELCWWEVAPNFITNFPVFDVSYPRLFCCMGQLWGKLLSLKSNSYLLQLLKTVWKGESISFGFPEKNGTTSWNKASFKKKKITFSRELHEKLPINCIHYKLHYLNHLPVANFSCAPHS